MEEQGELLPVKHEGGRRDRLRKGGACPEWVNAERTYLAAWKKWNRRDLALARLLAPQGREFGVVSRRDAYVAATVIQWLGTNCGLGFIYDCERTLKRKRAALSEKRLAAHMEKMRPSLLDAQDADMERARLEREWRARQRTFNLED